MQIKFSILQIPALHLQPRHQFQSGDGQELLLSSFLKMAIKRKYGQIEALSYTHRITKYNNEVCPMNC